MNNRFGSALFLMISLAWMTGNDLSAASYVTESTDNGVPGTYNCTSCSSSCNLSTNISGIENAGGGTINFCVPSPYEITFTASPQAYLISNPTTFQISGTGIQIINYNNFANGTSGYSLEITSGTALTVGSGIAIQNAQIGISGGTLVVTTLDGWSGNTITMSESLGVFPSLVFSTINQEILNSTDNFVLNSDATILAENNFGADFLAVTLNGEISGPGSLTLAEGSFIFKNDGNTFNGLKLPEKYPEYTIADVSVDTSSISSDGVITSGPIGIGTVTVTGGNSTFTVLEPGITIANPFEFLYYGYMNFVYPEGVFTWSGDKNFDLGICYLNGPGTIFITAPTGQSSTFGTLSVQAGTLIVDIDATLTCSNALSLGSDTTLTFNGSGTFDPGNITGTDLTSVIDATGYTITLPGPLAGETYMGQVEPSGLSLEGTFILEDNTGQVEALSIGTSANAATVYISGSSTGSAGSVTEGPLGLGPVTMESGSSLVSTADGVTIANEFISTNSIYSINSQTGTFTWSGAKTMLGTCYLNNGTTGNVVLAGTSSFSNLNLAGGTLTLDSASTVSVSNGITVSGNSSTLTFNGDYTLTAPLGIEASGFILSDGGHVIQLAGVLSGSETLTKEGTGTIVFGNNDSSYTGNLLHTAGSISLGGTGTSSTITPLGTGSVTLTSGTQTIVTGSSLLANVFQDTSSSSVTYFNINTGATFASSGSNVFQGALRVNNTSGYTGSLSLTGSNNIASLYVDGGSLFVGTGGTFTSGNTVIVGDALLSFSENDYTLGTVTLELAAGSSQISDGGYTVSISSLITGTGTLGKQGTGTLTITNSSNSYAGGTNLAEGTIVIGSDISTSSEGTLGAPSAALTGSGGTLQTTGSFSTSRPVVLSSGSNTSFSPVSGTTLEFTGSMTGSGSMTKTGPGTLVLASTGGYTGKTYVSEGSLVVNGDITASGDPIVYSGGTLSGTGTVGDTFVYGTIAGGDPVGTLSVDGNLTMESGSFFQTNFVSSESSLVAVTGSVTINSSSTYLLSFTSSFFSGSGTVSVLNAGGGVSGTFDYTPVSSALFFEQFLSYGGTEVFLTYVSRLISPLTHGQNAINVAGALDGDIVFNRNTLSSIDSSGGHSADLLATLYSFTTTEEMTYALNQLHPALFTGQVVAQQETIVEVRETLSTRLQGEISGNLCGLEPRKEPVSLWIAGLGGVLDQTSNQNGDGPQTGYLSRTAGFTAGADVRFASVCRAGLLGGYTSSHIRWRNRQGTGNMNAGYGGLYFSALGKMLYANTSLIGSSVGYNAKRNIVYPGVNLTAESEHLGRQLLTHLDTGLNISIGRFTIRPFDAFDYVTGSESGYSEQNAGEWNLSISKRTAILIRNELGLQLPGSACFAGSQWTLAPKVSWIREVRPQGGMTTSTLEGSYEYFRTGGYSPDRSLVAAGVDLRASMLADRLSFALHYEGEFRGGYSDHNYGGELRFSF